MRPKLIKLQPCIQVLTRVHPWLVCQLERGLTQPPTIADESLATEIE